MNQPEEKFEYAITHIVNPHNFVRNFADMEHFKEWARGGIINHIKDTIRTFEHYELYEHCAALQEVIDEKVDKMLSGLGFED